MVISFISRDLLDIFRDFDGSQEEEKEREFVGARGTTRSFIKTLSCSPRSGGWSPTVESFITEKVDTDLGGRVFHINEFIESGFRAYVNSFMSRSRGLNFLIIAGNRDHEKGIRYIHEIGAGAVTIKPSSKVGRRDFCGESTVTADVIIVIKSRWTDE